MVAVAEAEISSIFTIYQTSVPLRVILQELGHPQPPTPIQTDNTTVVGFAKSTIKLKRTKAMDMNFHWIIYRIYQKGFIVYWRPGPANFGDYFTKHHSPDHHCFIRPIYVHH